MLPIATIWRPIAYGAGVFAALLLLACVALWLRGNHYHAKYQNEHIARENDRKAYEIASKQAEAKAVAQKQAVEAAYRVEAEKTDADYQTTLARAQRASDAYAARMRAQIARGASGSAPAPADRDAPESPDGPGAHAVVVGRDDFDILIENSVRLRAAHDWAKTLNAGAIPDPAF